MVAPAVESVIVTFRGFVYLPPAGLNVGVAAMGLTAPVSDALEVSLTPVAVRSNAAQAFSAAPGSNEKIVNSAADSYIRRINEGRRWFTDIKRIASPHGYAPMGAT